MSCSQDAVSCSADYAARDGTVIVIIRLCCGHAFCPSSLQFQTKRLQLWALNREKPQGEVYRNSTPIFTLQVRPWCVRQRPAAAAAADLTASTPLVALLHQCSLCHLWGSCWHICPHAAWHAEAIKGGDSDDFWQQGSPATRPVQAGA